MPITSYELTQREMNIMDILWESDQSLAATEFPKYDNTLTVHTVQFYLKKLLAKELIEIDKIITSGNNLTRCYKPSLSKNEFEEKKFLKLLDFQKISPSKLILSFFEYGKDTSRELQELNELEKLIKDRKQKLINKTNE